MSSEPTREEVEKLLSQANELIGQSPINWDKVSELMDKLRAVVRQAERPEPGDSLLTVGQANEVIISMTRGALRVVATYVDGHESVHLCRVGEALGIRLQPHELTRTGLAKAVARYQM